MAGSWMRRFVPWLSVLGWMALISYWSGQSDLPIDQPALARLLRGEQHQLAHTAAFGILAVLLRWALGSMPRGGLVERRLPDAAERLLSGVVRRGIAAARAARDAPVGRWLAPVAMRWRR